MKTSIFRNITALAAVLTMSMGASAQNLSESVTVEGHYTPETIPADRLPILPATITLKAPESPMAYDRNGVAADFAPDALSMPATGWLTTKTYDQSKGYLRFRLGSWLNSSLSAGIIPIKNETTTVNAWLQHNSTSLWQAWKADEARRLPAADKRERYDEAIGVTLSHTIDDAGTLSAGVKYHLGYFNYYTTITANMEDDHEKAPTQTLNDLYANVGWSGRATRNLTYRVRADVRHFAYRAAYTRINTSPVRFLYEKGERETTVNAGGDVAYALSSNSTLNAGLLYSGVLNSIGNDVNRLRFTPGYEVAERNYSLRLGVDLAVTGGQKTRFRIAPDVSFSARSGMAAFSAKIGGGTHLRTLAWMHEMDYYSDPLAGCTRAAYSPLDASMALQLNPGGKWTLGIEGTWRTTLDETYGGTYQSYLDGMASFRDSIPGNRIHGISIAINAGYDFGRYLSLKGRGSWQPQHGNAGFLNGFDRPTFTLDASAASQPIDRLSLTLSYRLRARRELLNGNISRLDLSAEYRITDRISAGAELRNLLNRHEEILPCLPLEGLNAAAGLQIVF